MIVKYGTVVKIVFLHCFVKLNTSLPVNSMMINVDVIEYFTLFGWLRFNEERNECFRKPNFGNNMFSAEFLKIYSKDKEEKCRVREQQYIIKKLEIISKNNIVPNKTCQIHYSK